MWKEDSSVTEISAVFLVRVRRAKVLLKFKKQVLRFAQNDK